MIELPRTNPASHFADPMATPDRGSHAASSPLELVLVTGPMVGASSWRPTADRLRDLGWRVHVPDVLAMFGALPPWSELSLRYADLLSLEKAPILIGKSLATVVIADMASRMPVSGLIMVDGEVPPPSGPVTPGRDSFRKFVAGLADRRGRLPLWSDWWRDDPRRPFTGIDELAQDAEAFTIFKVDQPRVSLSWFDDKIDLAPWTHITSGYIRTSAFCDHAANEAERRNWPVVRLDGTHLNSALQPEETAAAIQKLCLGFNAPAASGTPPVPRRAPTAPRTR